MQFRTLRVEKKLISGLPGQLGNERTKYNFHWRINDHIKLRPVTLVRISSCFFFFFYVGTSYQLYKIYLFNCNFMKQ